MKLYISHNGLYEITAENGVTVEKASPVSASSAIKELKAQGYTDLVFDDIGGQELEDLEFWGV